MMMHGYLQAFYVKVSQGHQYFFQPLPAWLVEDQDQPSMNQRVLQAVMVSHSLSFFDESAQSLVEFHP